jgi:hypothetical protein
VGAARGATARPESQETAGVVPMTTNATDGGEQWRHQRSQYRDDGARALRAVFSSQDNWPNLSEAERDEWRGYFDRMLEWLHHLGYTPNRNPWSVLLEGSMTGAGPADDAGDEKD